MERLTATGLALCCLAFTAPATVLAADSYWIDSDGHVVRDGSGDCVHAINGTAFPECGSTATAPAEPEPVADSDGDGIPDNRDRCPGTPRGSTVDSRGCVVVSDSDGDGVPDSRDRCPGTPAGSRVDASGCIVVSDSDGDGIPDDRDLCANTPAGATVNASGCVDKLVVEDLQFATNTADLQPESRARLSELAGKIKGNPAIRGMTITGHTDSLGAAAYNQQLSEQRAQAVRNYFIEEGIAADKMRAVGMGESEPVADNATAAGRAQNRRVEIDFNME